MELPLSALKPAKTTPSREMYSPLIVTTVRSGAFLLISKAEDRLEASTTLSSNRVTSGETSDLDLIRSRAQATAPSGRDCNCTALWFGRDRAGTIAARPIFFSAR